MEETINKKIIRAALNTKYYRKGLIKSMKRGYYKEGQHVKGIPKDTIDYEISLLTHWDKLRNMPEEAYLFKDLKEEKDIKAQEEELKEQYIDLIEEKKGSKAHMQGWRYGQVNKDKIKNKILFWKKDK